MQLSPWLRGKLEGIPPCGSSNLTHALAFLKAGNQPGGRQSSASIDSWKMKVVPPTGKFGYPSRWLLQKKRCLPHLLSGGDNFEGALKPGEGRGGNRDKAS